MSPIAHRLFGSGPRVIHTIVEMVAVAGASRCLPSSVPHVDEGTLDPGTSINVVESHQFKRWPRGAASSS